MTTPTVPHFLSTVSLPDGVTITYLDPEVLDPYDHSAYYEGQVLTITGPNGALSIEARGETRLSDGAHSWVTPEEFRSDFPTGNAGELGDTDAPNGGVYTYTLTNWFDLFDIPDDEDDDWYGRDYAISTLTEAIEEAISLVK